MGQQRHNPETWVQSHVLSWIPDCGKKQSRYEVYLRAHALETWHFQTVVQGLYQHFGQ